MLCTIANILKELNSDAIYLCALILYMLNIEDCILCRLLHYMNEIRSNLACDILLPVYWYLQILKRIDGRFCCCLFHSYQHYMHKYELDECTL